MTPAQIDSLSKKWARQFASRMSLGRHMVDDLSQEAAIACLRAAKRYRPEKGSLENYARLWAFALMQKHMNQHGAALGHGRHQPITHTLVEVPTEGQHMWADTRATSGHAHETVVAREALARASDERQYVMVVMRIEGHTMPEIAAAFGVSQQRVDQILEVFGEDMIR